MTTIKKYVIWSVLFSALIGLSGCGSSSSSDVPSASASDFSMTLDVAESAVSGDWEALSSASGSDTLAASVETQGKYGTFVVTGDTISYRKTTDTNETDTGVLEIGDGADSVQVTVTVHSLFWKQMSEGTSHTSAIKSDGTLWSWGMNNDGQLGDGTMDDSKAPVQESTEATDWISISSGGNHSAAIKSDGTIWSWGLNNKGQLGDGTRDNSMDPVQESMLDTDWSSVRCGNGYSVGKKANGHTWRWGRKNTAPVADAQSVITDENVAKLITLSGSDANGDPLTYSIVTGPSNGTLSVISGTQVTYTPSTDYTGADSFTFKVNDGTVDSAAATVSITVNPAVVVNTPPVADAQSVITDENVAKLITLSGSDANGDPLTYSIDTGPSNGTLSAISGDQVTYTPSTDYSGVDSFTFRVNDGTEDSAAATVSITVNDVVVNIAPVADAQSVVTDENVAKLITLSGSDANGDPLTYSIVTGPSNGTLSVVSGDEVTYTPTADYTGADSFTFTVNDGMVDSAAATVSITVNPAVVVNTPPVADAQSVVTDENVATAITLTGSDADSDPLTYSIVTGPSNGTLSAISIDEVTYTPTADYTGADSFIFKVNDGTEDSALATVSITVDAAVIVNTPPTASDFNMTLDVNESTVIGEWTILSSADDVDSDPLTAMVMTQGTYGTCTVTDDSLSYLKTIETNATDTCELEISDGEDTVQITVTINSLYWKQISTKKDHTVAIKSDGTLWAWGRNSNGQLGDGTTINRLMPTQESTAATNWSSADAGDRYTVAIKDDGTLWAWGNNGSGQLGDGTTTTRSVPTQEITAAADWSAVSAGDDHTVALKDFGTLWAWGHNGYGQLGDGTTIHRSVPTQEITAAADWSAVSTGRSYTVALKVDGTLWAWGTNGYGQLGDGTTTEKAVPTQESTAAADWSSVSTTYTHTVALKSDGTLWAWGTNGYGQLGDGTTTQSLVPVQESTEATDWSAVSAGGYHTAALKTDGTLWAWGSNNQGQLGDGTTTNSAVPVQEETEATNWSAVSAGSSHTVAIMSDGTLWAWGYNYYGQLGDGTTTTRFVPTLAQPRQPAASDSVLAQIGAEGDSGDAVNSVVTIAQLNAILPPLTGIVPANETAYQDYIDANPDLFSNPATQAEIQAMLDAVNAAPSNVAPTASDFNMTLDINESTVIEDWTILSSADDVDSDPLTALVKTQGAYGTCVVTDDSLAYLKTIETNATDTCELEISDGTDAVQITVTVNSLYWKQISAGAFHTTALKSDGTLWTWGSNTYGQLGDGTTTNRLVPTQESTGATDWKSVSGGDYHTVALKVDGTLWAWGRNFNGEIGDGTATNRSVPTQESTGATDWSSMNAGGYHTLAIKDDGTLWAWGYNAQGQLGTGMPGLPIPMQESTGATDWSSVSGGGYYSVALKVDGTLWSWGDNRYGQLGDGTTANRSVPTQESTGATNWSLMNAGGWHTVAIKDDGTLWAWGYNLYGQIGDGTTTHRSVPTQEITGDTDWNNVEAGTAHTVAIKDNGTLWAWGWNNFGQLGDGTTINRLVPTQESSASTNWSSADGGDGHTVALKSDGTLQASTLSKNLNIVATGALDTVAIESGGTVLLAWGNNSQGQLGDGTTEDRLNPTVSQPRQPAASDAVLVQIGLEADNPDTVASIVTVSQLGDIRPLLRDVNAAYGTAYQDYIDANPDAFTSPATQVEVQSMVDAVNAGPSNVAPTASDFNLTLDVNESTVIGDWKILSSADDSDGDTLSASVVTQGNYGTFVVTGDSLTYLKTTETNTTDTGVLEITDGTDTVQVTVNLHSLYWKQVSASAYHTVALKSDGTLWAWGQNRYGELGDGTMTQSSVPVQESTAATNWSSVSAGGYHTAALKTDGTLWAWGDNGHGQLGDGTTTDSSVPVQESTAGTDWSSVSGGNFNTLALKTDGTLWAWGDNGYGQLGDGTTTDSSVPVQESTAALDWSSISAGVYHTVALKTDGTLWAWGENDDGELGDGTTDSSSVPVQESTAATDWSSISAGYNHTAALKTDGTLWAWGRNDYGQLGDGTTTNSSEPVQENTAGTDWSSISAGFDHITALKTDGTFWAWGSNEFGQLGDGTTTDSSVPVQESTAATDWSSISAGAYHTAALKTDGTLWAWGWNYYGELGDGTTLNRSVPTQESTAATNWSSVSAGGGHTVALRSDGTLWAWGGNYYGQLGDGTTDSSSLPVQESTAGTDWSSISAGSSHTSALKSDGTLWAWGKNEFGQLGDGTTTDSSIPVQESTKAMDWIAVNGGTHDTAALKTDGTLWAWGWNYYGQLGDGTTDNSAVPVQESTAATDWSSVSAGSSHTAALKADGTLWAWGYNYYGELGDGTTTNSSEPVQESTAATDWSSVSVGGYHTAALRSDGTLWAWGRNSDGQLGDGTTTNSSEPVQENTAGTDWSSVSAGSSHTSALKTDGTLWAWGDNRYGQLGDGTTTDSSVPVQENTATSDWISVSAEFSHVLAFKADGTLWAWGNNGAGQTHPWVIDPTLSQPRQP